MKRYVRASQQVWGADAIRLIESLKRNPYISFVEKRPNYYDIYYLNDQIGWLDENIGRGWLDDDVVADILGETKHNTMPAQSTQVPKPSGLDTEPLDFPDVEIDPDDYRIEW